ncbi:unnamed protein product [Dibothriocephalus latus]|uniref:Uncharacterized protein n=1 Tax=Dibothriocephalus latus TaxID=60516 RepID=A0A3P7NZ65_DIBLA|nr:unnamed protein product [Dibothriocephalus latus]
MTHSTSNCLKICDPPSQLTAEKPASTDPETTEVTPESEEQEVKAVSECPVEDNPEPIVDEEEKELISQLTDVPDFVPSNTDLQAYQSVPADMPILCAHLPAVNRFLFAFTV